MTDLLSHPLWEADSLGSPLPDHDFGVSVSLPLWKHVVGYEEGDPEVVSKFRSGYPRFCCPPAISEAFGLAELELAAEGERAIVFPRLVHAQRCVEFIAREGFSGRALEWTDEKHGVALFPAEAYLKARRFWRFCGEVVSTRQACHILGRTIDEPTVTVEEGRAASALIRQRLADLAGQKAEDVFLFPSGMAANFAVHRMLTTLFPERKTIQLDFPYVDVLKLQQMFGRGAHFLPLVDETEYEQLKGLLAGEKIAGLFCEAPSNPLLRCVDLPRLLKIRHDVQPEVPLIIDDTVSTSVNADACRAADIVTSSLTKSFSGIGDVLAGSVILNRASPHHAAFSAFLKEHADHDLWHADAVALEANSRDFVQRAQTMSRNAEALADHLRDHPLVERVWHAKTDGGVGYETLRRENGGYGCLFSFLLKDAARTSEPFYDALRVCKGPSLGTNFTLVCPYTLLAHYEELDWAESCGVPRYLIRVSAGLEDIQDLVARFDEALALAAKAEL
ncbi:cystathionine gamma-synthase [Prosthecobacter debontii]|uniref:Cystathionine gamma-synthase n=1 Tax=Prosthecobacter debontii TaxID=48467 RepID=A0A1T4XAD9_9BACT|nr:PLP-dependent transferase [Prosthecobacter debontii]SKA86554.1 cystathionine gamma-synthase [Prosthecobacter debontii]